ncbi:MAG TPA: PAS domain S-box protein [Ktedonobacterales bacterium]|nr:PAS domain S-box protein [Ktedonobacterales bacterium]
MPANLQATLMQLFAAFQQDPDSIPAIPLDEWQAGTEEWRLLERFRVMAEQVQQRIQQLQQAEQQLREREEQYRSIFEATYDGLSILGLEGSLVEVNPAFCQMFGYTREELIMMHASTLTAPDQLPVLADALQAFKTGKGTQTVGGQGVRKDGTTFHTESQGAPITYRGQPHVLAVSRDITERVEAERQLREREALYRGIFETTYDVLMIFDLDGYVVEANPASYQLWGYPYEEIIGMHGSALMAPASQAAFNQAIELNRAGTTYQGVGRGLRKDGTTFLFDTQTCPISYRGQPHVLAAARDITKRVEAERALREREALYRSIFEATYDSLGILDLDGHLVEVNPAWCQTLGYTREELLGLHISAINAPASQSIVTEGLEALNAGRRYTQPAWAVRKDGSVFPYDAHGSPITYRGQPHSLVVARDITEQVEAQHLLEQRVEERTRELTSLLSISQTVASTLRLQPLLALILEQLQTIVDCTGTSIMMVEGDEMVLVATRGPQVEQVRNARLPMPTQGPIWERIRRSEVVFIDDVWDDTPLAHNYRQLAGDFLLSQTRAWMGVPLTLKGHLKGMLVLISREVGAFTEHHAALALAIANQAAIAVENARLYEQAQALAALEERQKLARELHDSVSQALYGISLGAHTARKALEQDPAHIAEPLDYVLSLAEAGLAEMRALIFELRPESLEAEGLVSALTKQGTALQARHELSVHLDLCDEPDLPLAVKQELYRIAQEAMHNTVKHARARHVDLCLSQTNEAVQMEVRDDGVGFDPQGAFPGHLGLHSMRERVSHLGGTLQIESTPGQGTRLCAQVPKQSPA